jgi:hypothetical protein
MNLPACSACVQCCQLRIWVAHQSAKEKSLQGGQHSVKLITAAIPPWRHSPTAQGCSSLCMRRTFTLNFCTFVQLIVGNPSHSSPILEQELSAASVATVR